MFKARVYWKWLLYRLNCCIKILRSHFEIFWTLGYLYAYKEPSWEQDLSLNTEIIYSPYIFNTQRLKGILHSIFKHLCMRWSFTAMNFLLLACIFEPFMFQTLRLETMYNIKWQNSLEGKYYYICALAVRTSLRSKSLTWLISGVGKGDRGKKVELGFTLLHPLVLNFLWSKAHIADPKITKLRTMMGRGRCTLATEGLPSKHSTQGLIPSS